MLTQALDRVLAEDGDVDAAIVFDDLGNVVAETSRGGDHPPTFAPTIAACLAARAKGAAFEELRLVFEASACVVRPLEGAFVALACAPRAPLGRLALRLRLHHDALLAALP
jgi:hypothetical protein